MMPLLCRSFETVMFWTRSISKHNTYNAMYGITGKSFVLCNISDDNIYKFLPSFSSDFHSCMKLPSFEQKWWSTLVKVPYHTHNNFHVMRHDLNYGKIIINKTQICYRLHWCVSYLVSENRFQTLYITWPKEFTFVIGTVPSTISIVGLDSESA